MPVPRPTQSITSSCMIAAIMAAAAEVLPMPISPKATKLQPAWWWRSIKSRAIAKPLSTVSSAIAGSKWIAPVPAPRRWSIMPSTPSTGVKIPQSITSSVKPTCRQKTLIAAPPWAKFCTIWRVTSLGAIDTPSAAIPWSPANTNMVGWTIFSTVFCGWSVCCESVACTRAICKAKDSSWSMTNMSNFAFPIAGQISTKMLIISPVCAC